MTTLQYALFAALIALAIIGVGSAAIGAVLTVIHPDCGVLSSLRCVRL